MHLRTDTASMSHVAGYAFCTDDFEGTKARQILVIQDHLQWKCLTNSSVFNRGQTRETEH